MGRVLEAAAVAAAGLPRPAWTAGDLLPALDTHPDTGPYAYATSPPNPRRAPGPAGWVLHRLKPWRSPDGTPVTPFSQTHTAALTAHHAEAAADRRSSAAATGPTPGYRAARAALPRGL